MSSKNLPIVDWLKIESSAPGKFIISGEYSVVYEKQAIAAAIDLRTKVVIRPNKDDRVRLHLKDLNNIREWPTTSLTMYRLVAKYADCLDFNDNMLVRLGNLLNQRYHVSLDGSKSTLLGDEGSSSSDDAAKQLEKKADDAAMAFLLLYIGLGDSFALSARPAITVEVSSDVPVGSGLGSSSALSVALCGALMKVFRVSAEKYIISNWAFNVDKFFHGKPSGVDNSIVTNGGYILFQNGKIKYAGVPHKNLIRVLLIDTGVSRSTKSLGEHVKQQLRVDPTRIKSIFNQINDITHSIWEKINAPNFSPEDISVFLQANQEYLDNLGVGHPKLTDIRLRARSLNLTAKQTGAGGGGTAFVLYDDTVNRESIKLLSLELRNQGYSTHDHLIGCDGLRVEMEMDPDKEFKLADR